jgi:TIR domain
MPSPALQIFISYAKTGRPLASKLVAMLETEGWKVWWDTSLAIGDDFRNEIMLNYFGVTLRPMIALCFYGQSIHCSTKPLSSFARGGSNIKLLASIG